MENPELKGIDVIERSISFSGPLPHPALLAEYEQACSGAADRILTMAEKEQEHRHQEESKMMDQVGKSEKRGQYFAGGIAIIGLTVAAIVAILGNGWTAAVLAALLGVGGFGPIVVAFLKQGKEE